MAIPKYTAQRRMLPIPSGARAWPEAMSREQRAMAGFGGTVMTVAQRWQAERDNFEISEHQSAINDFQFKLMGQLEDDWMAGKFKDKNQFKKAEDDYEKARDMFIDKRLKGRRGIISDRVRAYADAKQDQQSREFYNSLFSKEKEFRSVEILKMVEGAMQRGDRDEALKIIKGGEYWLGFDKAERVRTTIDEGIAGYQHQAFLEQIAVDMRGMPYEDAMTYANQIPRTAITETERNDLIRQRERQEEIATASTNPLVRWRVIREITDNPKAVTDDYLESLIKPNSLHPKDAEALKNIRDDKDNPLKTPRAQLYFNSLDALFDERETNAEQRLKYDIANEKLMQFFETTKTPTAKQAAEFYDDLVRPEVLSWLEWYQKVLRPKETTPFWRHFGTTEEAALARKEAKTEPKTLAEFEENVRLLDEKEAKEYYEKWKDKW